MIVNLYINDIAVNSEESENTEHMTCVHINPIECIDDVLMRENQQSKLLKD